MRGAAPAADEMAMASRALEGSLRQCDLIVPGIHCGACIALIERELPRISGMKRVRVNLSARRAVLVYDASDNGGADTLSEAVSRLEALGYASHLPGSGEETRDRELGELLRALAVAGFAAMNVMLLSVSVWAGADAATRDLFHLISALIAAPAILYSGRVFFRSAVKALRHGRTNMDVPISIGVILAYAMSLHEALTHGAHAYFDASLTLLFFLLAGRVLDRMMRARARSAVNNLVRLAPRGAMVLGPSGRRDYRRLEEIEPGMHLALAAGERVPVDGRIAEGHSDMDFSLVSGESQPVRVAVGDEVPAGALNLTGSLVIKASRAARDSFLSEMAAMMEVAESGRARYRRIADRASSYYAPVVHLTALLTFVGWIAATGDWQQAMVPAVAVLIITCPCALGLAVPVVQVVAASRLFEYGIMVKDGSAMERLAEADHAVFDKTGTLTRGRPMLADADEYPVAVLELAANIARHSRHPLSMALSAHAKGDDDAPKLPVQEIAGEGVEARASDGTLYRLGRPEFALEANNIKETGEIPGSRVAFSRNGQLLAIFRFTDTLRPGAKQAISTLRERGFGSEILSGDNENEVSAVARQIGMDDWHAQMYPAGKVARLEDLRSQGRKVLMVGDGLNDAPALAAAHVSIAPASAADVGRQAADFVFLHEGLDAVPLALAVSRRAGALVRQNFVLAIGYNVIAVPAAILGYASPLVAAIAMSSSSIIVVVNSLRLKRDAQIRELVMAKGPPVVGETPAMGPAG